MHPVSDKVFTIARRGMKSRQPFEVSRFKLLTSEQTLLRSIRHIAFVPLHPKFNVGKLDKLTALFSKTSLPHTPPANIYRSTVDGEFNRMLNTGQAGDEANVRVQARAYKDLSDILRDLPRDTFIEVGVYVVHESVEAYDDKDSILLSDATLCGVSILRRM